MKRKLLDVLFITAAYAVAIVIVAFSYVGGRILFILHKLGLIVK